MDSTSPIKKEKLGTQGVSSKYHCTVIRGVVPLWANELRHFIPEVRCFVPPSPTPVVYKQSEMFRVGIQDVDKMTSSN